MGLSRTVSEIDADFSRKSQKFSHPRVFCAPTEGVPFEWVPAMGVKNWNDRATGSTKNFDDIFSRLDTINQRNSRKDGQTDGRTPRHSKDRAYV